MQHESGNDLNNNPSTPSQKTASHWFVLSLIFIIAFGIRLHNITEIPLDFSPIRQYQNAHIAKGLYFENIGSIPESRKEIARLNMERMGFVLEPRIIENAAVISYRIAGKEILWAPRVLSAMFWIAGGLFLYLIARNFSSFGPALFSTVFYLFLPYSISSSRSFQPDPLMVMMLLASIYSVIVYFENPSIFRILAAAAISSIAIFIKPYCLFPIWTVFILLSIQKRGMRKTLFSMHVPGFVFLSFIPAFFQYVYGIFTDVGFLQEHARGSFLPHLILSFSFWKGWLMMIGSVTGYLPFFLAIYGLISTPRGSLRTLLAGLWGGYLLFGLSATYQMHTHSYYHMPLIPIVALSIGTIGARVSNYMGKFLCTQRITATLIIIIVITGVVGGREQLNNTFSENKEGFAFAATVIGINPEFRGFLSGTYEKEVAIAKEIGELVGHSTNTVFLTPNFGRVIAYHGEFTGLPWPTSRSLHGRKTRGTRLPDIKNDFKPDHIIIGYQGEFIKYTPDYFIITDLSEFDMQPDLKDHLNSNYPVLVKNENYLIYDLRKMSE